MTQPSRLKTSLFWSAGQAFATKGVAFVGSIALARLLSPQEFGLVAIATVVGEIPALLLDAGLVSALIQRKDVREVEVQTVFWFGLALSVVIALGFVSASPLVAAVYDDPRLIEICLCIGATFVLSSFAGVPRALLTRAFEFRRLALVELAATAVGMTCALAAAVAGLGYRALLVQLVVVPAVRSIASAVAARWRPRPVFSLPAIRPLMKFGANLTGNAVAVYLITRFDSLVLGKYVGPYALGIYQRAFSFMNLVPDVVERTASRVMFPALSQHQQDPAAVKALYLRSVRVIALLTVPPRHRRRARR